MLSCKFLGFLFCFLRILNLSSAEKCHSSTNSNEPLKVEVGDRLCLDCSINGNGNATKTWLYNNIPLESTDEEVFWNANGTLEITTMRQKYAGWYTCSAENTAARLEMDYLLIAVESEESKELVSISLEFMYRTVRGSQVELPCIIPGRTAPNVWYKDGNVIGNEDRYTTVDVTGSLIINNVTAEDFSGKIQCNNQSNSSYRIAVMTPNGTDEIQTALLFNPTNGDYAIRNRTITCIDSMGNEQLQDYVIEWTINLKNLSEYHRSGYSSNTLTVSSSGFYCCHLSRREDESNSSLTFCATVLIEEIVLPTSVSLPGYRGRFVSLLCHIFPGSEIYTPYQLTWGDRSLLEGVKSQGSFSYFLSFAGNPTKLNTTCMGERAFNSSGPPRVTEASVSVVIVEISNATNLLKASGFGSTWQHEAGYGSFYGEMVFYVNRSSVGNSNLSCSNTGNPNKLTQILRTPIFSTSVFVSGRMRQEFSEEVATINIISSNGVFNILNPFPNSEAWQWVSGRERLCKGGPLNFLKCLVGVNVTLELTTTDLDCNPSSQTKQMSSMKNRAFFDDLHLSAETDWVFVTAVGGAAAVLLLVLLLIITLICCCCYCCHCHRHRGGSVRKRRKTKKMSKIEGAEGFSNEDLLSELRGATNKRSAVSPVLNYISGEELSLLPTDLENSSSGDVLVSPDELTRTSFLTGPEVSSEEATVVVVKSNPKKKLPTSQPTTEEQEDSSAVVMTSDQSVHKHVTIISNSVNSAPREETATGNGGVGSVGSSRNEVITSSTEGTVLKNPTTYQSQSENQCDPLVRANSAVESKERQWEDKNVGNVTSSPSQKENKISQNFVAKKLSWVSSQPLCNVHQALESIDSNVQRQSERQSLSTRFSRVSESNEQSSPSSNESVREGDSVDPEYVYLKAGDEPVGVASSKSAEKMEESANGYAKSRSDSLTSQGYIDVGSLAIEKQRDGLTKEDDSTKEQNTYLQLVSSRPHSDDGGVEENDIYDKVGFNFRERRSSSITTQGYVAVSTYASDDINVYDKPDSIFNKKRTSSLTSLGYVAVDTSHIKARDTAEGSSVPHGAKISEQSKATNKGVSSGETADKDKRDTKKRPISLTNNNTGKDLLSPEYDNCTIEEFTKGKNSSIAQDKKTSSVTESKADHMNPEYGYESIDSLGMQYPQSGAAPISKPKPKRVAKRSIQNYERDFVSRHSYSIESNDDSIYDEPHFRPKAKSESLKNRSNPRKNDYQNFETESTDGRQGMHERTSPFKEWLETEADYCYISPNAL